MSLSSAMQVRGFRLLPETILMLLLKLVILPFAWFGSWQRAMVNSLKVLESWIADSFLLCRLSWRNWMNDVSRRSGFTSIFEDFCEKEK